MTHKQYSYYTPGYNSRMQAARRREKRLGAIIMVCFICGTALLWALVDELRKGWGL